MDKKEQGKKNRKSGAKFELLVRKDLESKGWIVSKWQNNVEEAISKNPLGWEGGMKLIPAKRKFNPFTKRPMVEGTGFPDFIAYQFVHSHVYGRIESGRDEQKQYHIIGVEAKSNGYLDKEEKEKCRWLLENNIFSKILIAKKGEKRGEIIYKEVKYK